MIEKKHSDFLVLREKYSRWYSYCNSSLTVCTCGGAFYCGVYYQDEAFAKMIVDHISNDLKSQFASFLKSLDGNWAMVVLQGDILYAATDRVRSYPILYSEVSGKLLFTDDISEFLGNKLEWCVEGVEDFLWTGYPTGVSSLLNGVYQIPPGMFLCFNTKTYEKELIEYFRYLPTGSCQKSPSQMSKELASLFEESVRRLRKIIKGKIIVPLSGGMDSRLIIALLKKNGFEDVLCFTYGHKNNSESLISKKVAETLGYEWVFIEYSPETWAECMFSPEMKNYLNFSCNACSMPVYSNFYAVKMLSEMGVLSSDVTFLPGHTGDFIGGGHIPKELFIDHIVSQEELVSLILKKHYNLWPGQPSEQMQLRLTKRIQKAANSTNLNNIDASSLYEAWDWNERQSKMILNSDRVYEFFGYKWSTPLWSSLLIDFCLSVPFEYRCNRKLFFQAAVEHVFTDELSSLSAIPLSGIARTPKAIVLNSRVDLYFLYKKFRKLKKILTGKRCLSSLNHPLCIEYCFAAGNNPLLISIGQMLKNEKLDFVLDDYVFESILDYIDKPIGRIHPYGILSLYVLLQMYVKENVNTKSII